MTTLISSNDYLSARLLGLMPAACAITLGLLYLMHLLIYVEDIFIDDDPGPKLATVVMEDRGPIVTHREKPPEKIIDPMPIPEAPEVLPYEAPALTNDGQFGRGLRHAVLDNPNPSLQTGNQLLPYLKVAPQYPTRALSRGIEGFVDVYFNVSAIGRTENISVTYSEPSSVFDRASIKAVGQWKYKPRHVDGAPVATYGLKERIRFTIEK